MIRANMTRSALSIAILATLTGCGQRDGDSGNPDNPMIVETRGGAVYLEEYRFYVSRLYPELSSGEIDDDIQSRVFHSFLRELIIAEFQRVTDEEVEEVIAGNLEMANQLPALDAEHQKIYRGMIRRRLAVRQLLMREVIEATAISDEDVARYYQDHEERFKHDARYTVRIVQTVGKAEADALRKELASTKDPFRQVAAPYAENDGHLIAVPMTLDELPEVFAKALRRPGKRRRALEPGQYTPVIPVKQGEIETYYVLYLESMTEAVQLPLEDVYFTIRGELERERAIKLFNQKVKRFREKIRVKVHNENLPFTFTEPTSQEEV